MSAIATREQNSIKIARVRIERENIHILTCLHVIVLRPCNSAILIRSNIALTKRRKFSGALFFSKEIMISSVLFSISLYPPLYVTMYSVRDDRGGKTGVKKCHNHTAAGCGESLFARRRRTIITKMVHDRGLVAASRDASRVLSGTKKLAAVSRRNAEINASADE